MIPLPSLLATALATALESVLNGFLKHNPEALPHLSSLSGKVLQLRLSELAAPLVFIFSDQAITILTTQDIPFDCCISTRLALLPKLLDQCQLIPLIREGQLDIEGDLSLPQQLFTLSRLCEWDAEAWLSDYLGDVLAHGVMRMARRVTHRVRQQAAQQWHWLRDMLVEEWRLLPGRSEAVPFTQAVEQLQRDVWQLERRLQQLSQICCSNQ